MWSKIFGLVLFTNCVISSQTKKPNIIVIVADDMGFNDVGFRGSDEIKTPNIDALAYNGVIFNSHYTQALCTPSRAAFLTGKYPIHLGMQHLVILEPEPWGLPLNETLLPQHLKRNGYKTHAVGKWHLGFFKKEYTPTYRGFDTHFGYWQGLQDYYKHTVHATFTPEYGYDMRRNMSVDWDAEGKYSTTLFTEEAVKLIREHNIDDPMFMYLAHLAPHTGNNDNPLQAPDEEIAKFAHIADPERRIYAAMVSMLDKSVGTVVAALREKQMLENSIILFMSDNGAQTEGIHANHGSNYPLRGMKNSPWEGASRGVAAIWSPLIKKPQRVFNHIMHISDWLPTFYSAAGLDKTELTNLDGIDMWNSIAEDTKGARSELIYNIDDIYEYGAIRKGDFKYLYGSTTKGKKDAWYGSSGKAPIYNYDEQSILESQAGSTLAGFQTFQQIKEKNSNPELPKNINNDFEIKLLDVEKIRIIREQTLVKCKSPDNEEIDDSTHCDPLLSPCLFNLREDPCEMVNLASKKPNIVMNMEASLAKMKTSMLPPRNVPRDPNADPAKWNNTWTNWQDCDVIIKHKLALNPLSPVAIGFISAACIAFVVVIIILAVISIKRKEKNSRTPSIIEDANDYKVIEMKPNSPLFEQRQRQLHTNLKDSLRTLE